MQNQHARELISTQNTWIQQQRPESPTVTLAWHAPLVLRMYLRWNLCSLYLHACQVRVTVGDSCLCCCTCVMYFKCQLTPLCVNWGLIGIKAELTQFLCIACAACSRSLGRSLSADTFLTGPLACCWALRENAPIQPRQPSILTLVLIRRWIHFISTPTPHSHFVPAILYPDPSIILYPRQACFTDCP